MAVVHREREVYNVPQAAKYLGITTRTLYTILNDGQLRGRKAGRAWKIHRDALREYLMPPNPEAAA